MRSKCSEKREKELNDAEKELRDTKMNFLKLSKAELIRVKDS